mmetsp:Transcript_14911/g.28952  ORF Transcript_14911/g.28952 Transcript_14911/m.28952 type:complete len:489 (+) Transcript_14911:130-1596(+)|eukprot:CAMPEP_0171491314 /NCGR_PEP_ID=MMETSP0958-20121227/3793_1 /TAXON_ID=87120 /ORGANISM="Aurantiochytrium limacinum, Strain ATCCMYA-1381" /LENGTH=488 /DNA_ID=CAMNT_0012024723 /DNA_START=55 /DNA_END=1521 /DNA_ORIENTATION=-
MPPRVWLEIGVNGKSVGTLRCDLFGERAPRTVENFRALCTGEKGSSPDGQRLHFKASTFHRLIPGFMIQGGDIVSNDGTGSVSIYGETFGDEDYIRRGKHALRGALSMANSGPNSNGSQFFILFDRAPHLDGKHVVFGQVSTGAQVLDILEGLRTGPGDKPLAKVEILDCGECEDDEDDLRSDNPADAASHAQDVVQQTMERHASNLRRDAERLNKAAEGKSFPIPTAANPTAVYEDGEARRAALERLDQAQDAARAAASGQDGGYAGKMSERQRKLMELRQRKAQARSENSKQVMAEHERDAKSKASAGKEAANERWKRTEEERKKQLELLGVGEDKAYLLDTAEKAARVQASKQKKVDNILAAKQAHPFDDSTILRAYDKQVQKLKQLDGDDDQAQAKRERTSLRESELSYGSNGAVSDSAKDRMMQTFAESENPRKRLRNTSALLEGEVVNGINGLNEKISRNLSKAYDKYTTEIRQNFERGTAL